MGKKRTDAHAGRQTSFRCACLIGALILLSGFFGPCVKAEMVERETSENEMSDTGEEEDLLAAGQILEEEEVTGREEDYFTATEIIEGDEIYNRINGKSYYPNEDIGLPNLRYLKVLHYNFSHQIQVGELIVNAAVSEDVLAIFLELFQEEYEIESMRLIEDFWMEDGASSDTNSMEHNNTSAFCYRLTTSGGTLSNHALGFAIDINPLQNPYVSYADGQTSWTPEGAADYLDRTSGDAHMIAEGDSCYNIFIKYGFTWGGSWENPVDYQHFEKTS